MVMNFAEEYAEHYHKEKMKQEGLIINMMREDEKNGIYQTDEELIEEYVESRYDKKFTPPFRVGRKQGRAVLDSKGIEVIVFPNSEEQAQKYCDYLNEPINEIEVVSEQVNPKDNKQNKQ